MIDAGDLLSRAVGDVNTLDIRRGLPAELFGALLRFGDGEVVEEAGDRVAAVHRYSSTDVLSETRPYILYNVRGIPRPQSRIQVSNRESA